jgi:hypothetical protein
MDALFEAACAAFEATPLFNEAARYPLHYFSETAAFSTARTPQRVVCEF